MSPRSAIRRSTSSPGTATTRPTNMICDASRRSAPSLFDHPDPSIFTVLTAPSGEAAPPMSTSSSSRERWLVAEHTFRPPWYHRNIMSEFMGLIYGITTPRKQGFVPGGISLHNCMLPHGPDARRLRQGQHRGAEAGEARRTRWPSCSRRAFLSMLTCYAAELETPAGRLRRLLGRPEEALRSRRRATGCQDR